MKKKQGIRVAVAAAFLAAYSVGGFALEIDELEKNVTINNNAPIDKAQALTFGSDRSVTVKGQVGNFWPGSSTSRDTVDFYSFFAKEGDVLDINIDGGMKATCAPNECIDTSLYLLDSAPGYKLLISNLTALSLENDPGSINTKDAHIPQYVIPKDGTYYVAVTGFPRYVEAKGDGIVLVRNDILKPATFQAGTYRLTISGVSPATQAIRMEVKPGSGAVAPINPDAKGNIPVALLGSKDFDVLMVEPSSLTFGRTGIEESWLRCAKEGTDVNGDGFLDLVCHFDNRLAKFATDTVSAILRGKLKSSGAAGLSASSASGGAFEGHADLKVRPQ